MFTYFFTGSVQNITVNATMTQVSRRWLTARNERYQLALVSEKCLKFKPWACCTFICFHIKFDDRMGKLGYFHQSFKRFDQGFDAQSKDVQKHICCMVNQICSLLMKLFGASGGRNRLYKNLTVFTSPKPGCFQIPNTRIKPSHRQNRWFFFKVQVSQPDSSKWWWQQKESCGRGAFCTLWRSHDVKMMNSINFLLNLGGSQ